MGLEDWEWTCACCGKRHRGVPDLSFEGPIAFDMAESDPEVVLHGKSNDFCAIEIDGRNFVYIRCVMPIPLRFAPGEAFRFGVWSTLSAENALRYRESFEDADQSRLGAMFGYLGNVLPGYPDTENMHLNVWPQDGGQRPEVWVRDNHADHPLFTDQAEGWDEDRLAAMLSVMMPCAGRA